MLRGNILKSPVRDVPEKVTSVTTTKQWNFKKNKRSKTTNNITKLILILTYTD